jgi:small subunit ribosomal protein S8
VDTIGDFLTIIRNGVRASKRGVVAPYSKMKASIAEILKREGFVRDVRVIQQVGMQQQLEVVLKYRDGESAIHEINRLSTPGCRRHTSAARCPRVRGGFGVAILTTSKGLITDKQARELNVGGELVCEVW